MSDYIVSGSLDRINETLKDTNEILRQLVTSVENIKLNNYNSHFLQYTDRLKMDEIIGPGIPPRGPIC